MASGGRHGLAQSIFQVGGNAGAAFGPLLAAWVVLPHGQKSLAVVFALRAARRSIVLAGVGVWYTRPAPQAEKGAPPPPADASAARPVLRTLAVLMALMFSKFFYLASISSYSPSI